MFQNERRVDRHGHNGGKGILALEYDTVVAVEHVWYVHGNNKGACVLRLLTVAMDTRYVAHRNCDVTVDAIREHPEVVVRFM